MRWMTTVAVCMVASMAVPATTAEGHDDEPTLIGPFAFETASSDCRYNSESAASVSLGTVFGDDCSTWSTGSWSALCWPSVCGFLVEAEANATRTPGRWTDSIQVLGLISIADNHGDGPLPLFHGTFCEDRNVGIAVSCDIQLMEGSALMDSVAVEKGTCGQVGWGSAARAQRAGEVRTLFVASDQEFFDICYGVNGAWTVTKLE